jgi:hypothetical protein
MLHPPKIDLRKTRFAMDVLREAAEAGERRGAKRGLVLGQPAPALRLLRRRIGEPTPEQRARIEHLSGDELGGLGESLPDFAAPEDLDRWL